MKNLSITDANIPRPASQPNSITATQEPIKKKFNVASAGYTPSSVLAKSRSTQSPKLSDLPSFIPTSIPENDQLQLQSPMQSTPSQPLPTRSFNPDSPAFTPSANITSIQTSPQLLNPYLNYQPLNTNPVPKFNPYAQSNDSIFNSNQQSNFMYQQPQPPQQQQLNTYPLQYHLYAPTPPPHLQMPLTGNKENSQSLFIPGKLREALTQKNEDTLRIFPNSNLPEYVDVYYDLYPLDKTLEKNNKNYGFTNSLFKAFSNIDGHVYALRRIENVQLSQDKSVSTINRWKEIKNSNVSKVIDAFTTRAFGDNSLIVVYDYYPSAKTLDEIHCNPIFGEQQSVKGLLWTYLIQISMAIASIHSINLAARSISLQKILLTSKNRIRLSDIGVNDILQYNENQTKQDLEALQLNDLTQLGKTIFKLYLTTVNSPFKNLPDLQHVQKLDFIDIGLKNALVYLLDESNNSRSIFEFQSVISSKLYDEFDKTQFNADYYEAQLTKELENSRLVRLMAKINFIIERPELNKVLSPNGDKYPITLFHHYVFHQVDENGHTVLDLSHVLRCLNKLDVGIDEKILLVSADEQSCLIVSYRELKDLIARTFTELLK